MRPRRCGISRTRIRIGHSIAFRIPSDTSPAREIVGVVADIKDGPPDTPAIPAAYIPFDQIGFGLVVGWSG